MGKVTNFTLPSGDTVEIQDPHALTLDENTDISGTFDFGLITGAGNYNVPINATGAPNTVSVTTGTLKVIYDNDKPIQIYLHRITNQIFVRSLGDNGSWSSWIDITMTEELTKAINNCSGLITSETNNRTTADTRLNTLLNNEVTDRKSADSDLSTKINAVASNLSTETSARTTAISTVNSKIDSLTATIDTHSDNIKTLNSSVSDLSSRTEWKFYKSVTGQTTTELPSNWNELYIGVNFKNNLYYTFYVPKIFISSSNVAVVNTYPSDSNGYCNISVTSSTYKLSSCTSETSVVVASAITYLYYR